MKKNFVYQDNVVDLNELKRKIYNDFNVFGHKTAPTTDPIEQRTIMESVMDNISDMPIMAQRVLLKIVRETVFRGRYYTFMSQRDLAESIGCSRRALIYALNELKERNWVATKVSDKKPYRNCTDFNVGKVMPIKPPKRKSKRNLGSKSVSHEPCANSAQQKRTLKDSSKEESICGNQVTANEPRFIKKEKRKRTCRALAQTWNTACANSSFRDYVDIRIPRKEYVKFKALLDNLHLDDEEIHEFIEWNVSHWDYCWRRFRSKNMPKIPNHNWFIACRTKFYEIWWENLKDLKPNDERVVQLKDYVKIDSQEKWRDFTGFEYDD